MAQRAVQKQDCDSRDHTQGGEVHRVENNLLFASSSEFWLQCTGCIIKLTSLSPAVCCNILCLMSVVLRLQILLRLSMLLGRPLFLGLASFNRFLKRLCLLVLQHPKFPESHLLVLLRASLHCSCEYVVPPESCFAVGQVPHPCDLTRNYWVLLVLPRSTGLFLRTIEVNLCVVFVVPIAVTIATQTRQYAVELNALVTARPRLRDDATAHR